MINRLGRILVKHAENRSLIRGHFLRKSLPLVVVINDSLPHVFWRKRDVEIPVEVVAVGRHPFEIPAHPFLECLNLAHRSSRYHSHAKVSLGKMDQSPAEMIYNERATCAALFPLWTKHE